MCKKVPCNLHVFCMVLIKFKKELKEGKRRENNAKK
jgi:hypothetical protein